MADYLAGHELNLELALKFYAHITTNFDAFESERALPHEALSRIFSSSGTIHLLYERYVDAKDCFMRATKANNTYLLAYQNLIATLIHLSDSESLDEVRRELEAASCTTPSVEQRSQVLSNLASAYVRLQGTDTEHAVPLYSTAVELDPENWLAKICLGRLMILANNLDEAERHLSVSASASEQPFLSHNMLSFHRYFALAGLHAIKGNLEQAEDSAINAGITRHNPDETRNLQGYITELKRKTGDPAPIHHQIREAVRKMEFPYRLGHVIDPKSIEFPEGKLIGYHGTSDATLAAFQDGIQPQDREVQQFSGRGFYIGKEKEIAYYFAMKKAREHGGKPIIFPLYAQKSLVGKSVGVQSKITRQTPTNYDCLVAPIDGFEKFSQVYAMERSLQKLRADLEAVEPVEWSDDDFTQFAKRWTCSMN